MWNLSHGLSYVSVLDISFWANHSNLIALLFLPIYAVFQHPLTLVFLKLLSFIGAGYCLFLIGYPRLGARLSILVMLLFWVYPPNVFAVLYEFDFESLSPGFLSLLFYFFIQKKFPAFVVTGLLTVLIKENMPLIMIAFGIYALFSRREQKWLWVLAPLLIGILSFYFLTCIFIPHFQAQGGGHPYLGYYKSFGNSPFEIILGILTKPWEVIPYLLKPINRSFLFDLFSPLMYLPLLSPHVLFLMSPILLQHMLSYAGTEHTIYYQYASSFSPFIFIAMTYSLGLLRRFVRPLFFCFILALVIVCTCLSIQFHGSAFARRNNYKADHLHQFRWNFVKSIPPDASVIASFDYVAELSGRKDLYAFHKVYHDSFQREDHRFLAPSDLSYALIDFSDGWIINSFHGSPQIAKRIHSFILQGGWTVKGAAENIVLFTKGPGIRLVELGDKPFYNDNMPPLVSVDERFSLTALDFPREIRSDSFFPLTFYWESSADIKDFYTMLLILRQDDDVVLKRERSPGYFVYPTTSWAKGDHIKERYWLYIPDLPEGRYTLETILVNNTTHQSGRSYPLTEFAVRDK